MIEEIGRHCRVPCPIGGETLRQNGTQNFYPTLARPAADRASGGPLPARLAPLAETARDARAAASQNTNRAYAVSRGFSQILR